ncbi:MAG TPA: DUF5668 domain-containing protein [Lacibacter sp.]|nr:DUF5668 domain-containing protein [Lacibacter sp.]
MKEDASAKKQKSIKERILIGTMVIIVGLLLVLRNTGFPFPSFLFSWPMIVIAAGIVMGIRDNFRNNSWWLVTAFGCFFLASRELPHLDLGNYVWPAMIIAIGIFILLGKNTWTVPKTKQNNKAVAEPLTATENTEYEINTVSADTSTKEDKLDAAAIFGAVKKNIYSKNFKGGEVVAVFGGAEINLLHADFKGEMKLEIVNIFGGTTLFVPAHWQIRSEAAAIMGAIEDKRREPTAVQTDKVLVIEGFVLFGGIDIKSV